MSFRTSSLAIIVTALATNAALAQQPGFEGAIVVTAQKREQNLQEVPAAVSVITGDAIGPAINNIENLSLSVPTLNFRKGGTNIDSALFLRGVGTINFSIAAEPSVATVLDGVVLARAGEAFSDLSDIERVEVLRGPQGTLFGKNASAGVINIVTRAPAETLGGELELSAFEDEEYKLRGAVDVPVGDTLRTRFNGFVSSFDGNVTNLASGEKINGYDRWGVRGRADWDVTPKLALSVIADYRRSDEDCCGEIIGTRPDANVNQAALLSLLSGINLAGPDTREVRHNLTSETLERGGGVSVQADYTFDNDFTLTSITAWRSWEVDGLREGDWLDRPAAYVSGAGANVFNQLHDFTWQDNTTFTQELRLASPEDGRLRYVLGAFYYKADAERLLRRDVLRCDSSTLAPDATGLRPCAPGQSTYTSAFSVGRFGSEFTNYAAFGQLEFDVTEALTAIAGLRLSRDELTAFNNRIPAPASGIGGLTNIPAAFNDSVEDDGVSGKLGLQYAFSDAVIGYATYARGYKGPAFNVFFNQQQAQRPPLPAEESDSYEIGLKNVLFDGRLVFNAAAFYALYDNYQTNTFDVLNGVTITALNNIGEVKTQGVEIDFLGRVTDSFTLSGALAYTDAEIDNFRRQDGTFDPRRSGEQLPLAPEWKWSLGADYRWSPEWLPANLRFNAQYAFTDDQNSDLGARRELEIDSYGLLDAFVAISDRSERTELRLIGRNLTDEQFTTLITPGGPGNALRFAVPREADRYFGVALRQKFGS